MTDTAPPSGLYYVDRDTRHAYLLTDGPLPALDSVDRAVVFELAWRPGYRKAHMSGRGGDAAAPVGPRPDQFENMLGAPFGLYYATTGGVLYDLVGPGDLAAVLGEVELVLLRGYIAHVVDEVRRVRAGR